MSTGDERARKLDKRKKQYTGGSFSSQALRAEQNKHYENVPLEHTKKRIKLKDKKAGE